MPIDLYTTSGALVGALFMLIWGLCRDGKFDWKYLPEYVAQAATGIAAAGIWQVPDSVPPIKRFIIGLFCGAGGKQIVSFIRKSVNVSKKQS